MVLPPLDAGAVHETVAEPFSLEVAVTEVGAPGAVANCFALADELDFDL